MLSINNFILFSDDITFGFKLLAFSLVKLSIQIFILFSDDNITFGFKLLAISLVKLSIQIFILFSDDITFGFKTLGYFIGKVVTDTRNARVLVP